MRKIVRGIKIRRNNASFHTAREKWAWSIILTGTRQERVISSFIRTSRIQPVEDLTPRGICGMCDAFSAPSYFIVWRQRWLSWVFMMSTVRSGKSCYDDSRCPHFLGYIRWFQNINFGCCCCDVMMAKLTSNIFAKSHLINFSLFISFNKVCLFLGEGLGQANKICICHYYYYYFLSIPLTMIYWLFE